MNITEQAVKRRVLRTDLAATHKDGCCLIMSLDSDTHGTTPGVIAEVTLDNAARCIVQGSHRLATPDEVKAHRADMAVRIEASKRAALAQPELLKALLGKAIEQTGKQ